MCPQTKTKIKVDQSRMLYVMGHPHNLHYLHTPALLTITVSADARLMPTPAARVERR